MKLFSKAKDLFDGGKMEDLIDRVHRGHVDYIKTVDQNLLLKTRNEFGNTCLSIATIWGNLDLCEEILKKCPSLLYQENNKRQTVLHLADNYRGERFLFIDFFVSVGVNELATSNEEGIYMKLKRWMKMQDYKGDTALIQAAREGNLHVVKRFIEVDRRYNLGLSKVVGDEGKTALDCAVENKDHEMLKLLTDDGDPYLAMDLFDRVKGNVLDYVKTVELNVLLNSRDQNRMSAICIATKYNRLDCCKEILKRCPSLLYHQNNQKESVLHHAADRKNYRLIDFYVNAGLEAAKGEGGTDNMIRFQKWINLQNRDGNTALIFAVVNCSHDIVKTFVEVDRQYKLGLSKIVDNINRTALHRAMQDGDHEIIKMLTGYPNLGTDDKIFPILVAIQQAQEFQQTENSSGTEDQEDEGTEWQNRIQ